MAYGISGDISQTMFHGTLVLKDAMRNGHRGQISFLPIPVATLGGPHCMLALSNL